MSSITAAEDSEECNLFWKRLASGVVLLAAAVAFLYIGGTPLLLVLCAISLIGQNELYRAIGIDHKGLSMIGYLMTIVYYMLVFFEGRGYMAAMIVFTLIILMTAYVATFPEYKTEEVSGAFFGMCYVSVLMSYVYLTRQLNDGLFMVWLILLSSWGSDTLAYCTGMLFGEHHMVPRLSPKKTWEGAAGGVAGAAILGFIYGFVFRNHMPDTISPAMTCCIACAAGAVISMIGDLAASAIKRNHNIKDFGNLIPGHGGVLDRFDSMLFTAPAIYYAVTMLEHFHR